MLYTQTPPTVTTMINLNTHRTKR
uniref:Uncharacterized protein n=1 Tax=Anguilla anguilla TaxID=7936 RepID=A0A0E9RD59_ANGAN